LNPIGTVHGGCLYTLADVVAGAAVSAYGNYAATVSSSFYYLEPAKNVQKLYASATVSRQGKSLCVIDVVIWSEPGTIIAKGSLSYYILNKEIAMTD